MWLAKPGNAWSQPDLRTGSTVLGASIPAFVPGHLLASVGPDPAVSFARLTLRLQGSQAVAIDVLDIRGRRIRRIESAGGGTNSRDVVWDLRDMHDRRVAPGVYLVHAVAGAQSDMRRIVVLR